MSGAIVYRQFADDVVAVLPDSPEKAVTAKQIVAALSIDASKNQIRRVHLACLRLKRAGLADRVNDPRGGHGGRWRWWLK